LDYDDYLKVEHWYLNIAIDKNLQISKSSQKRKTFLFEKAFLFYPKE